eukprot:TRINITY_DN68_c0_g1_i1.p1 TRINITY_DN68_c0_g1~~TRINITY_DN68_c0_g1_i1.p1  ORF type:complete len:177 (-),score=14.60 TRINITY_DN68_c0_g1_i1:192-722(-)
MALAQLSAVREEALATFRFIDTNGDGKICRHELTCLLERIGHDDTVGAHVDELFRQADVDGNGVIDFDEFLQAADVARLKDTKGAAESGENSRSENKVEDEEEEDADEDLRVAFDLFDCDGSGGICAEELQQAIAALSGERTTLDDCKRMIAHADVNGDGLVDFSEFKVMMVGVLA